MWVDDALYGPHQIQMFSVVLWHTFQSPVWKITPSEHRKTSPQQSGMECVTLIGSISNGPALKRARMVKVRSRPSAGMLYSFNRLLINF